MKTTKEMTPVEKLFATLEKQKYIGRSESGLNRRQEDMVRLSESNPFK